MARAPFRVFVYPYIKVGDSDFEYVLLRNRTLGFWQGAAGGGEGNENPLEAATRETYEETGIHIESAEKVFFFPNFFHCQREIKMDLGSKIPFDPPFS